MNSKVTFERKSVSTWSCRDVNQHYTGLEKVGSGTYGEVHKAQAKDDPSKIVALKKIRDETETEGFPITALREISILQSLNHPNVVRLFEVVTAKPLDIKKKSGSTYLVFEYMEHELLGFIESVKLAPAQVKCIMKQMLEGLDYLHSLNIIHRDIKSANILINNNGEVKIADFGLAKRIQQGSNLTPRVVTRWYRAPELLLGSRKYTGQVDMWALGCVFAELLIGKTSALFPAQKTPDQFELICEKCGIPDVESWPGHKSLPLYSELKPKRVYQRNLAQYMRKMVPNLDDLALELLEKMLVFDPEKRINAKEALNHPYFSTSPLPSPLSEMPRIEKDCHAFTIKAEREKHREMMNNSNGGGNAGQNKGGQSNNQINNQRMSNPFFQKQASEIPKVIVPQTTTAMTQKQMQQLQQMQQIQNAAKHPLHESIIRSLQENLAFTKVKAIHRENSNQNPQTAKSDSTQDTDVVLESRNEEKNPPHISLQSIVNNELYCNPAQRGKGKASQQNLRELEKLSKKVCIEGNKRGKDVTALIKGTEVGTSKIFQK